MTDEELMERFQAGDKKAFNSLMERYERPLFNFILRLIGHPQQAEDLFQETFLRLYRTAKSYDPSKKFSPWLYKIAHNICIDELRKRKKGVIISWNEAESNQTEQESLASEENDLVFMVRKALDSLPEEHRLVLVLRHYQELSYEEISQALDIPLGTVKSRMHYALNELRARINPHAPKGRPQA